MVRKIFLILMVIVILFNFSSCMMVLNDDEQSIKKMSAYELLYEYLQTNEIRLTSDDETLEEAWDQEDMFSYEEFEVWINNENDIVVTFEYVLKTGEAQKVYYTTNIILDQNNPFYRWSTVLWSLKTDDGLAIIEGKARPSDFGKEKLNILENTFPNNTTDAIVTLTCFQLDKAIRMFKMVLSFPDINIDFEEFGFKNY